MTTARQVQQALSELEGIAADLNKRALQATDSKVGGVFAHAANQCWAMQPQLKSRYQAMLKNEPQYR